MEIKCDNKAAVDLLNRGEMREPLRHTCGILWRDFFDYLKQSGRSFTGPWIRGHSGIPDDEMCDSLATDCHESMERPICSNRNQSGLIVPAVNFKVLHIPLKQFLKVQFKTTMIICIKDSISQAGPLGSKESHLTNAMKILSKLGMNS